MTTLNKQTKAFTMLELVFVIVVLGILAALALPRMDRDLRQEAADNVLSAIRYTQHLALNDDKTDPFDGNWQKNLWKITFSLDGNNGYFYTISSRNDTDYQVDKDETAIDPANGKYMFNFGGTNIIDADESPNIFLGNKYGINDFQMTGGCSHTIAKHIAFDHIGRLYTSIGGATNQYESYVKNNDCNLTFKFRGGEDDISIIIKKETGYAYIDGQPDS